VLLSQTDIVEPDILMILEAHRARIGKARIEGPPDLAIEVLSPSTRSYDRKTKLACYARFGIPEFWLVDPEAHEIEQLVRPEHAAYQPAGTHRDTIRLHVLPDITLDLSRVWS
jgi:Uma2 family endonuclease